MVTGISNSSFTPLNPLLPTPGGETDPVVDKEPAALSGERNDEATPASPAEGEESREELTPQEKQQVAQLKITDRKVRDHEQAHIAAGGRYIRGRAQLEYATGPDGRRYAVGGEVSIDTSRESNPERTLQKAQTIRQAALAPADPSPQDRRVASQATQIESQAQREIAEAQAEEVAASSSETNDTEEPSRVDATAETETRPDPAAQTEESARFPTLGPPPLLGNEEGIGQVLDLIF